MPDKEQSTAEKSDKIYIDFLMNKFFAAREVEKAQKLARANAVSPEPVISDKLELGIDGVSSSRLLKMEKLFSNLAR